MTSPEQTAKFLPGFFLDVVEMHATYVGGKLPLHISLFPPVQEPYKLEYGTSIKEFINPMTPFDVTVGEEDEFSDEEGPVRVKRIRDSGDRLQLLHQAIVRSIAHLKHDDQYRQPYNPHVSLRAGQELEAGSIVHIAGLSIVEKNSKDAVWEVVDKLRLKGTNETTA